MNFNLIKIIFIAGAMFSSHAFAQARICPPESQGVPCGTEGPSNGAKHFSFDKILSCVPDSGEFQSSTYYPNDYVLMLGIGQRYALRNDLEALNQGIVRPGDVPGRTETDLVYRPGVERMFVFSLVAQKRYSDKSDIGVLGRLNAKNGNLFSNIGVDNFRIIYSYDRDSGQSNLGPEVKKYLTNGPLPQNITVESRDYNSDYGNAIFIMQLSVTKVNDQMFKGTYKALNRDEQVIRALNVTCKPEMQTLDDYIKSVKGTLVNN